MADKSISLIDVGLIDPHPNNPRKDLGDLTELTDSIRQHGVMQNLTVIPNNGRYTALIGHRRLAAAKAAGLKVVPCIESDELTMNEQVSIMLLENMQRNDLTIYEQAQGFQMMLDLGDTAQTIAEKTGLSETTVYHRLNIAKLDQKLLKERDEDEGFQLSIKDLIALEKVKDVKDRNQILKESHDSSDLSRRALIKSAEDKRSERAAEYMEKLYDMGILPAPKGTENERYGSKWEEITEFNTEQDVKKKITVKGLKDGKIDGEQAYFVEWKYSRYVTVIRKAKKKQKQELSPEEIKRKEKEKARKKIKDLFKRQMDTRRDFIVGIITGSAETSDEELSIDGLWNIIMEMNTYMEISSNAFMTYVIGKNNFYELDEKQKETAERWYQKSGTAEQMLALTAKKLTELDIVDWSGEYNSEKAGKVRYFDTILARWGFKLDDEEDIEILNGTHKLYEEAAG